MSKFRLFKILIVIVAIVLVLIVTGVWGPKVVSVPESKQIKTEDLPSGVSRGEYIAKMSDCTACHTTESGQPFAGGLALPLPIGTIYSTNITPDQETGIGDYSLDDFKKVLREGIRKDGSHLYPAMPYTEYTKLSDSDIAALFDYFKNSVKPVNQANKPNDIPALLSMRWPLAFWNWMYLTQGPYKQHPNQAKQWNRGAYLVQGAAHCGTCHTPRGIGMQTIASDETTTGFLSGADLAGWRAFNITNDKKNGLGNWSQEQIIQYLKTGTVANKAQAAGPMGEAIEHSFRFLTDADREAISIYLRSVPAVSTSQVSRFDQGQAKAQDLTLRGVSLQEAKKTMLGQHLYMGNCSTCHNADGSGTPDQYYPSLYHNSVVGSSQPENLIQVILHGVDRKTFDGEVMMPAFASHLTDEEIATLVNFVTKTYGQGSAEVQASDISRLRK